MRAYAKTERYKEYRRQYAIRNREKLSASHRDYMSKHPEKAKEYQERYWEKQE